MAATHPAFQRGDFTVKHLLKDESGATMVEYGIMIALIAAVCILIITTLGKTVQAQFTSVNSAI
ncbi:MAG: Flp family type IVb pilin [Candidatus Eremiobacteraeota bacterium]|nr:Flp family type IVb pilin [Candidatus Eremiobacteraeota bacterium]